MQTDFLERRRHIRVYFDNLEEMQCRLTHEGRAKDTLIAAVLDLSLGGMHLTLAGASGLVAGDRLVLHAMTHQTGPVCEEETIPLEIRWIYNSDASSRLYLGCQFLALPEHSRASIANLISAKLLASSATRIDGSA